MSFYSETEDLYDELNKLSNNNIKSIVPKLTIEIGLHGKFLNIKEEKDVALFFPNKVIESRQNNDGTFYVKIEQNDYIRKCETQKLESYIKRGKRERQYCKKMRVSFVPEEAYNKLFKEEDENRRDKKILMKVLRKIRIGGKQKYNQIRLPSFDSIRKIWCKNLVDKYGYDNEFATNWIWYFGKRDINYEMEEAE